MSQRLLARTLGSTLPPTRAFSTTRCPYSAFDAALASSSSTSAPPPRRRTTGPLTSSGHSSTSLGPATSSSSSSSAVPIIPRTTLPPPPPSATPSLETELLGYLARLVMQSGKLERAHAHVALMLEQIQLQTQSPPLPALQKALEIVAPSIRVVGRKKGTKSLPTPQPLTEKQRTRQAWKWIVEASDKRTGVEKSFGKRLALEVMAVLGGQSDAIKKKEAKHQQGVVGRANVGR